MQTTNRFAKYDFNTTFPLSSPGLPGEVARASVTEGAPLSTSAFLPHPSGGGVREGSQIRLWRNGGGSCTSPSSSPPIPDPQSQIPPLSNPLIRDLLDPTVSTLDLCDYHHLTLPQLAELIHTPEFEHLKSCLAQINEARSELTQLESRFSAIAALTNITQQRPESAPHTESIRKAAT